MQEKEEKLLLLRSTEKNTFFCRFTHLQLDFVYQSALPTQLSQICVIFVFRIGARLSYFLTRNCSSILFWQRHMDSPVIFWLLSALRFPFVLLNIPSQLLQSQYLPIDDPISRDRIFDRIIDSVGINMSSDSLIPNKSNFIGSSLWRWL